MGKVGGFLESSGASKGSNGLNAGSGGWQGAIASLGGESMNPMDVVDNLINKFKKTQPTPEAAAKQAQLNNPTLDPNARSQQGMMKLKASQPGTQLSYGQFMKQPYRFQEGGEIEYGEDFEEDNDTEEADMFLSFLEQVAEDQGVDLDTFVKEIGEEGLRELKMVFDKQRGIIQAEMQALGGKLEHLKHLKQGGKISDCPCNKRKLVKEGGKMVEKCACGGKHEEGGEIDKKKKGKGKFFNSVIKVEPNITIIKKK